MPSRNFVREIKAENIKDINPSDIIYLALKDGSIVLIADNDEDTLDYDDLKSIDSYSQRRSNRNFYNQKYNKSKYQIKTTSSYSKDSNKNLNINNYSNYSRDKTKITNSYSTERNQNNAKENQNKNEKKYNKIFNKMDNNTLSRNNNIGRKNYTNEYMKSEPNLEYKIKKEKLEKSFENYNYPQRRNNGAHKIEYINNMNNSFQSSQTDYRINQRNKSSFYNSNNTNNNKDRVKVVSYTKAKTPTRRENIGFVYNNNRYNNNLDKINNLSSNISENSFVNKTMKVERKDIYKDYYNSNDKNSKENNNYRHINTFNKGKQIRSQSFNNNNSNRYAQTPQRYYVNRREMEIIGRIVNYGNSSKLTDHGHPNTLFDPKCPYCEDLARKNKLSLCNIKEESIHDNHSFVAIFGESGQKKGRSQNKTNGHYYNVL